MPLDWTCPFFPNLAIMWLVTSLALVWAMVWKGIALWRAGRNGHLAWFIVLFIVNTLGILPIIYIFAFSRKKE
jgi:methionyl-tRNA synthetase